MRYDGAFYCSFALAAALLGSAPAWASGDGHSSESLSIDVTARIAERCGISAKRSIDTSKVPDLDTAQVLRFDFNIDCNTPFKIGMSSQNGALRLVGAEGNDPVAPDGFSVEKAYRVGLRVDTDADPLAPYTCSSRDLTNAAGNCPFYGSRPGQGLSSGKRTAIDREGTITVSWPAIDDTGRRRAAGEYRDTITVVVGART